MKIFICLALASLLAYEAGAQCPPGVELALCLRNPCHRAKCVWYPDAVCTPNFCGEECTPMFIDQWTGVDVTEKCDCPFDSADKCF